MEIITDEQIAMTQQRHTITELKQLHDEIILNIKKLFQDIDCSAFNFTPAFEEKLTKSKSKIINIMDKKEKEIVSTFDTEIVYSTDAYNLLDEYRVLSKKCFNDIDVLMNEVMAILEEEAS